MDLLQAAQALPEPPVSLIMTAYGSVNTAVEAMRHGMDPVAACRSVIERLARLRGARVAASQVALLALDKTGRAGAFALQPGFTYAVTDAAGQTRIERAAALFETS